MAKNVSLKLNSVKELKPSDSSLYTFLQSLDLVYNGKPLDFKDGIIEHFVGETSENKVKLTNKGLSKAFNRGKEKKKIASSLEDIQVHNTITRALEVKKFNHVTSKVMIILDGGDTFKIEGHEDILKYLKFCSPNKISFYVSQTNIWAAVGPQNSPTGCTISEENTFTDEDLLEYFKYIEKHRSYSIFLSFEL